LQSYKHLHHYTSYIEEEELYKNQLNVDSTK